MNGWMDGCNVVLLIDTQNTFLDTQKVNVLVRGGKVREEGK